MVNGQSAATKTEALSKFKNIIGKVMPFNSRKSVLNRTKCKICGIRSKRTTHIWNVGSYMQTPAGLLCKTSITMTTIPFIPTVRSLSLSRCRNCFCLTQTKIARGYQLSYKWLGRYSVSSSRYSDVVENVNLIVRIAAV